MAIKEDVRARAPRGTKNVTQAFFEALDGIPENLQEAVASAALSGIRDEMKGRRLKRREAAARAKAKAPAKTKTPVARATKTAAPRRAPAAASKQAVAKKAPAKRTAPAKTAKRKSPGSPPPESATE
jgi:cell division septation protein DedD